MVSTLTHPKLLLESGDVFAWDGGTQSVHSDAQVARGYLSLAACDQLLQCIVDEDILGLECKDGILNI